MNETQRLCLEALAACRKIESDYYMSLARANLLLAVALPVGIVGNLFIWLNR